MMNEPSDQEDSEPETTTCCCCCKKRSKKSINFERKLVVYRPRNAENDQLLKSDSGVSLYSESDTESTFDGIAESSNGSTQETDRRDEEAEITTSKILLEKDIHRKFKLNVREGYFGQVFRVTDSTDQYKPYAFKQWNATIPIKDVCEEEINTLKSINHPNIVRIYQYYQNKTLHGVIEDYCYYNLHFVMLKSPKEVLSCHDRVRILLSISRALNYLHSRDIVHNNLTSDNILIDRYNVIKISHGGYHSVFTNLDREIRTGELSFKCYVQGYYSKAALHGKVQFENDIFSLGAVLFLMVKGEEYYSGEQEYLRNKELLKSESHWSHLRDTRIVYWPKLPTSWSSLRSISGAANGKNLRKDMIKLSRRCLKQIRSRPLTITQVKAKIEKWEMVYF